MKKTLVRLLSWPARMWVYPLQPYLEDHLVAWGLILSVVVFILILVVF